MQNIIYLLRTAPAIQLTKTLSGFALMPCGEAVVSHVRFICCLGFSEFGVQTRLPEERE